MLDDLESVLGNLNASRLYWLQGIVDLGKGWHPCGQVAGLAKKKYHQGTNYLYELGARFPTLVQIDRTADAVRIVDERFEELRRALPKSIEVAKTKHARRSPEI
jgi:hypothetical protein